jgi:DNA-binding CsgD family transcriptional regulator
LDDAGTDLAERLALVLAARNGAASEPSGAEFGKALADLAERIETAVRVLRDLIDLINPQGLPQDLHLTPRELELLGLLGEGISNTEIAKRCWISENTVKFHLKNLFKKLGVRDRGQAMMMARVVQRRIDR